MLVNIRSKYIYQKVVSYLYEKTKLNVIKYNKNLQKKLNIGLINYMVLSERYIIFQNDGEGKEYNDYYSELIFEGKFFKGKRHGKGKEYDYKGKLIFEGEYINGKRNGRGKEFYKNGTTKFEGEYLNGKKWNGKGYNIKKEIIYELNNGNGYIKEFNCDGKLEYEGVYENGERNGKGKEYDYGDLIFEGEYLNDQRNRKGKEYYYTGQL